MTALIRNSGYPPPSWLVCVETIEDIEQELRRTASGLGLEASPQWLTTWRQFKDLIEPGDEIWRFEDFPEALTGAAGYCIVRHGEIVASIVTARA